MPCVHGILETSLYFDDLQGALAFYQELFGFELFFREPRLAALGVPGGQVLLLFQRGATLEPAPGPGGGFVPPHGGEGQLYQGAKTMTHGWPPPCHARRRPGTHGLRS